MGRVAMAIALVFGTLVSFYVYGKVVWDMYSYVEDEAAQPTGNALAPWVAVAAGAWARSCSASCPRHFISYKCRADKSSSLSRAVLPLMRSRFETASAGCLARRAGNRRVFIARQARCARARTDSAPHCNRGLPDARPCC